MDMRHFLTAAAIGGSVVFAGTAQAASISSLFNLDGSTMNAAEDGSNEVLEVDSDSDGFLDVGDVITGYFQVDTLNSQDPALAANTQWSAIFALEVKELHNFDDGDDDTSNTADDTADIIFGSWDGFSAYLSGLPGGHITDNPAMADGTMVRMWERDFNPDGVTFDPGDSMEENIAKWGSGEFTWDIGFADEANSSQVDGGSIVSNNGEGWVARGGGLGIGHLPVDPDTQLGTGQFAVSVLQSDLNRPVVPHLISNTTDSDTSFGIRDAIGASAGATADISGFSKVFGPTSAAANNGFDAGDRTEFGFLAIPTPAAVGPGLALLGLIGLRRQRRQVA